MAGSRVSYSAVRSPTASVDDFPEYIVIIYLTYRNKQFMYSSKIQPGGYAMSNSYDAMWENLILDLDAHAGLLDVLGGKVLRRYIHEPVGAPEGYGISRFRALRGPRALG